MYFIEGRHAKKDIVELYVINLLKKLKIHRFTAKCILIQFKTELDKRDQTFLQQMQALAHEMVHARQFLRGQLNCDGAWKWKGRMADGYEYENQPWEKEAYRLERTLFLDCFPFELLVVK